MDIQKILEQAILENELSGNPAYAYKFSDPDGVRSGKSGWSFGRCQFDLKNNTRASICLSSAGFTMAEITGLINQAYSSAEMAQLSARLRTPEAAAVIDDFDQQELVEMITHTRSVVTNAGLTLADEETFVHLADYHNQFCIEYSGKCIKYLQRLGRPIVAADVLAYKLTTLWGYKRPDDVARRWNNIHCICAGV